MRGLSYLWQVRKVGTTDDALLKTEIDFLSNAEMTNSRTISDRQENNRRKLVDLQTQINNLKQREGD